MDVLNRVAKVVRETDDVRHHDHDAVARAAVATMFNWLGDPSDGAIAAGVAGAHENAATCRKVWAAMLSEMRKEAGF